MAKANLAEKAKEINDRVFGADRKSSVQIEEGLKQQVNENMRYSLNLALHEQWVSEPQRRAFVDVLKEQKDAIDILFTPKKDKTRAIQIIKPLFGAKSGKFLETFQSHFDRMQKELVKDLENKNRS